MKKRDISMVQKIIEASVGGVEVLPTELVDLILAKNMKELKKVFKRIKKRGKKNGKG